MAAPGPPVAGTAAQATTGTVSPTLPGSIAADDILVVWAVNHQPTSVGTISWPSGFTEGQQVVINGSDGTDLGTCGWAWKRATGSESGTISCTRTGDTGNDSVFAGNCCRIPGCITTGDPYEAATPNNPNTTTTGDYPTLSASVAEEMSLILMLKGGLSGNVGTPTNWTVVATNQGTSGTDWAADVDYRQLTTATSYDPANVTLTTDADSGHVAFHIGFKPPSTGFELNLESGSYAVTGAAAGVLEAAVINAAAGSYSVTGAVAGLARSFELNAEAGAYAVTGDAAGLVEARVLNAQPGSYAVTGAAADLVVVGGLPDVMPESTGTLVQHVAPTSGNDSTGDGSLGSPWKTINKAWTHASLAGGGIIYLRGNDGEHGDGGGNSGEATTVTVTSKYGDSDDPITMETYPGDAQAVINGTRLHLNPGDLKQNDYNGGDGFNVRIRNIKFTGGSGFGLSGLEAIKSNNPRNFEISGCVFEWESNSAILIRGMGREQALAEAVAPGDTSFDLDGVGNLLNATPFYMGITDVSGTADWADVVEIVEVTNITSNTVTVNRAQLGTTAGTHSSGRKVMGMWRGANVQIFGNVIRRAGMKGTLADGAQSISSSGTLTVDDTSVFPSTGSLNNTALVIEGVPVAIPYTSKTATTFTLGTFTGTHSVADNAPVLNSWASGHAHGIYYGSDAGTDDGAIYNNIIYDCSAFGITLHEEADETIVAYNTVDYCGRGGIDIAGENTHGTQNCIVTSNICTNHPQRAPIQGSGQAGFAINVWFETVGPIDPGTFNNLVDLTIHDNNESGYHTSNTTFWPAGSVVFSNDIAEDPLYTDQPNGDYTIQSGSPAEGAGDPDFLPDTDIFGTARVAADIGAVAASAVAYELNVEPGSYTLTGALAGALAARLVDAAAGSYAVSGADSGTAAHRVVDAQPGAYSVAGAPAGVTAARMINAAAGAYALTGFEAELVFTPLAGQFELALDAGVYTLTGAQAQIPAARLFNAAAGTYAITGAAAGTVAGRAVNAQPGVYTLTGSPAGLVAARALAAGSGSYTLTGADANLSSTAQPPVTVHFDQPTPSGGLDQPNPGAGHFDQPTPGVTVT